jgi:GDP-L-fucose synthase
MNVLLTGGSGMLGQAIRRLQPYIAKEIKILAPPRHELDLRDPQSVTHYFKVHSCDAVIHTAAKVGGIQANIADPVEFMTDNILISTHVIDAARAAGVTRLINLGSSCMYPRNFHGLLQEDDILAAPLEPTNEAYAIAKIAAAKLCSYISGQYGLFYRTFIPCNLYGPSDTFDLKNGHLIAAAIVKIHRAVQAQEQTVEIWGDGTARREFIYVDDLAEFILSSLTKLEDMPDTLNIGLGQDYTVNEYYQMIARVIGFKGDFVHNRAAPVGMTHKLMDITKAKEFGWNPETTFDSGMTAAYESYKS